MLNLTRLNSLSETDAREAVFRCCGSRRWADALTARRPFADEDALFAAAEEVEKGLTRADWMEAFAAHPRIGDVESLRKKFAATASWAANEQAGMASAPEAILQSLAVANRRYEEKFGHIFIVCATGKNAGEMLAILEQRLPNDPTTELRVASAEQAKITRLRLEKL